MKVRTVLKVFPSLPVSRHTCVVGIDRLHWIGKNPKPRARIVQRQCDVVLICRAILVLVAHDGGIPLRKRMGNHRRALQQLRRFGRKRAVTVASSFTRPSGRIFRKSRPV